MCRSTPISQQAVRSLTISVKNRREARKSRTFELRESHWAVSISPMLTRVAAAVQVKPRMLESTFCIFFPRFLLPFEPPLLVLAFPVAPSDD